MSTKRLAGAWLVSRRSGTASELHAPWPPAGERTTRMARFCDVSARALVIGSTQPAPALDAARAGSDGAEVVRRRTGGGAVLVSKAAQVWLDLWLPRGDPLWSDDVVAAAHFVGVLWSEALALLGLRGARVHTGRLEKTQWSSLVCFGGRGPGEVVFAGRKVMGVAQRRDRYGAWFHSVALAAWEPRAILDLMALRPEERDSAAEVMSGMAAGLSELLGRQAPGSLALVEGALETLLRGA